MIHLKQSVNYLVVVFILLVLAAYLYFLFFINQDVAIRAVGAAVAVMAIAAFIFTEHRRAARYVEYEDENIPIRKFILITHDGEREKEWSCDGMSSFLIGKGSLNREVDIELGDTPFGDYISNEHAVLNFSKGFWYIEDLESINGVGLKKKGEDYAFRLKPQTSYKIDEGDIIYISKAKILVR